MREKRDGPVGWEAMGRDVGKPGGTLVRLGRDVWALPTVSTLSDPPLASPCSESSRRTATVLFPYQVFLGEGAGPGTHMPHFLMRQRAEGLAGRCLLCAAQHPGVCWPVQGLGLAASSRAVAGFWEPSD